MIVPALLVTGIVASENEREEWIATSLERVKEYRQSGEYEEGLPLAEEILKEAEGLGVPSLQAEAQYQLALLHHYRGSYEKARSHLELGLTLARANRLEDLQADCLNALGILEWKAGNLHPAARNLEEALEIWKRIGTSRNLANVHNNLGIIAYARKDFKAAVNHYRTGIENLAPEASDRLRASLYSNLAESLIPLDDLVEAEQFLTRSLEIEKVEKDPHNLSYTYYNLGELRARQDDPAEAIDLFQQALQLQLSIRNDWAAALTRLKMAEVYVQGGETEKALAVLSPGYESIKGLNALTLLRDYSKLYAEIFEKTGNSGKATYYRELNQWFTDRMEAADRAALVERDTGPGPAGDAGSLSSPFVSTMRAATLGILAIIIGVLFRENLRLRRRIQDAGGGRLNP